MSKVVCVTGAWGYLGRYLIPELLSQDYKVRCVLYKPTGRTSEAYRDSFTFLATLRERHPQRLHLFYISADGSKKEDDDTTLDGALRDCATLIHIPQPYTSGLEKSNAINTFLDPIVKTSLAIYQSALREARRQYRSSDSSSSVRPFRIIFVGSCFHAEGQSQGEGDSILRDDLWRERVDMNQPELMAKIWSEKALWELFHSDEAEQVRLEAFALLMPPLIGPVTHEMQSLVLDDNHCLSENTLILDLLARRHSSVPDLHINLLDVRDATAACCYCLSLSQHESDSIGELNRCGRYLVMQGGGWISNFARFLHDNFPEQRVPISTMTPLRRRFHHNSHSKQSGKRTKQLDFDCTVTKEILGFAPSYHLDQSLLDCANSLIENGIVKERQVRLRKVRRKRTLISGGSAFLFFCILLLCRWVLGRKRITTSQLIHLMWNSFVGVLKV